MSRSHPLWGMEVPCAPQEGTGQGGHVLGLGSRAAAACLGQRRGCSQLCPAQLLPAPAEPQGAARGERGAPDWNHMEAHLQQIRPGASSSCLAGCAANLWGLSAPPRFPQRMFPGQSAAGLCAKLRPRQPRRKGAHAWAGTPSHTHSPDRSSRPLGAPRLGQGCFWVVRMPQCVGGEEVVHGRGYLANSQPGSPRVRGQLQQASSVPACPEPKIRQPGSPSSGAGVKSRLKGT